VLVAVVESKAQTPSIVFLLYLVIAEHFHYFFFRSDGFLLAFRNFVKILSNIFNQLSSTNQKVCTCKMLKIDFDVISIVCSKVDLQYGWHINFGGFYSSAWTILMILLISFLARRTAVMGIFAFLAKAVGGCQFTIWVVEYVGGFSHYKMGIVGC
jgi:hypothetical protein